MEDGILRFPLIESNGHQVCGPNDLVGLHLKELLDLLVPVQGGKDLRVDGYRLLSNRQSLHPLRSSDNDNPDERTNPLDLYEPRLGYIQHLLKALLDVVELEVDGKPVRVDGFRLRNPRQWLTPGGGASDIIAQAATRCNLNCRFCYNKGTSAVLKPRVCSPEEEYEEILERIAYYTPRGSLNLFPNMGSPCEPLAHPYILKILERLRGKTGEVFRLSTNGSLLTSEMIHALSGLMPVYLDVSLNSSSPKRRTWLMNDPSPSTAIDAPALLRDAGIPFSVVIVPWPFPSIQAMREDLEATIEFAARFDPALIQMSFPGCARALFEESKFPMDEVWNELRVIVRILRERVDCPLVIRPGLYEDYDDSEGPNVPSIIGVIKNSPAEKAGLRGGDRIAGINGLPVRTRPQARSLLRTLHQSDLSRASFSVEREGRMLELEVNLSGSGYPYTPGTATHLGAVFASAGIPQDWVERVKDVVVSREAKEVLLMTSRLVRPELERLISRNGMFSGLKIHLHVPRNDFFGGNIFMGDLMVVDDFIVAAKEFVKQRKMRPDLIVVPSSPFHLSRWGRDLTGRVYLDIERCLGIPVALVECEPIFD